jgi:hypothetical protein
MKIEMSAGRGRDLATQCSRLDLRAETDGERELLAKLVRLSMKGQLVTWLIETLDGATESELSLLREEVAAARIERDDARKVAVDLYENFPDPAYENSTIERWREDL